MKIQTTYRDKTGKKYYRMTADIYKDLDKKFSNELREAGKKKRVLH